MKKLELMNKVLTSTLNADDKALLSELLLRADDQLECFPSVERLCQVRGMKHEKNFKGVEHYLPGLVTKQKRGRRNFYTLNGKAIAALPQFKVSIKHTPALGGVNTPAVADDTPAVAENSPAVEGANSTKNNTKDSSIESTRAPVVPPVAEPSLIVNDKEEGQEPTPIDLNVQEVVVPISSTASGTPATEGLSKEDDYYEWNGRKILKAGRGDPFGGVATAPVETEAKPKCSECSTRDAFWDGLCWDCVS